MDTHISMYIISQLENTLKHFAVTVKENRSFFSEFSISTYHFKLSCRYHLLSFHKTGTSNNINIDHLKQSRTFTAIRRVKWTPHWTRRRPWKWRDS